MTTSPSQRPEAAGAGDRGLQAERTALSWWRTSVGAMANALLFLHVALTSGRAASAVLALVALAALVVVVTVCVLRSRMLRDTTRIRWTGGRPAMATVSAAIFVVAVTAAVVELLEPGRGVHL